MGKEQTSSCWMQTAMSADAALLWDDGKLPYPQTQMYWTHQRWNGEYLYWQVSDGELTVVVVSHVVILQALITLPAGGESETERKTEREKDRERETGVCGGAEEDEEYSPGLGQWRVELTVTSQTQLARGRPP